ncbi:phosphate ABC transporter substrate-binding protein PstS [Streptomyces sp. NPDC017941]|uniref:phosphate ABC transporter substrate-binding protein PstS n=1 Tax=unclassified Streptomyces TaxID=2593676 RepID=UPI003787C784
MKLQRKNRRALTLGALAVSGALALTACGSDDTGDKEGGKKSNAASDIKCEGAKGQLAASGSSAQKNAIDAWVKQYTAACKDVQVQYNPTGSGAGITAFLQGQSVFAGSDSALKPDEIAESKKKVCKDSQAIDLPMVGGPIAVGFNVPGVDKLVLDAKTLGDIFNNKIKNWDDKAIEKLNPDAKLPSTKIQAFHRSDESGTTDNFTKYLKGAAPSAWPYEPGKTWTPKGGQSAQGSSGVAQQVKQTAGAISYMELSYAEEGIKTVDLKTEAKEPVEATVDNASKAISEAKTVGEGKDLALELNYKPTAEGAYPITLVTYEVLCEKGNKKDTLPTAKSFLSYIASEDGQAVLKDNGYAPIPDEIITKVRETVAGLS